ncbi:carbohydrate ABC transporter permease [Actinoplanes siamensis]|uniref:ABC transporter permease n=1 Tax=Actinoplanes siamensis TaxID=1223317 RepID=A0A919N4I7_9ACTN|nr:sugar ABC transporter permease [Actinoplanes siamensis]GIF04248.1 ABC transporter permease [Actinoplanes siamensis]
MTAPGSAPARRRVGRNTLLGWSFLLPNFLGFAVLTMAPVALLFYYAFTTWDIFGGAEWSGLDNARQMIHDSTFWNAVRNTLYYTVFHIPLTLVVSLGLAVLLNKRLRAVAFFRTVAFFPYIASIVAVAQVWNMLFSPGYGPVDALLRAVGVDHPPGWTTSADWSMPAVILVGTWREMGYFMLIFLAGLQTVPAQLYEAARVDGANAWQRLWAVTLPGLRPTTFFVIVMLTINSFKVLDLILVMTNGGPGQSTLVLAQYVYRKGFEENQFGYASAVSVVLFLLCLLVTMAQFAVNRRREA